MGHWLARKDSAGWRRTSGDSETIFEELRRDFSGDLEIGGPTLAADFIRRGLVDEYALVVHPVILGGGTPFLPGPRASGRPSAAGDPNVLVGRRLPRVRGPLISAMIAGVQRSADET